MIKPFINRKNTSSVFPFAVLFLACLLVVTPLRADQSTEVRVTATVIGNCKIISAEDLNFGELDPGQAVDTISEGNVSFACTKGINYSFTADNGEYFDSGTGKRRMQGGASVFLPYSLNDDRLSGLGQGFSNVLVFSIQATVLASDYQDLPAAAYVDTIRIVVEP